MLWWHKDFTAGVLAVLLALPTWVQEGCVSGLLNWHEHGLGARSSGTGRKASKRVLKEVG